MSGFWNKTTIAFTAAMVAVFAATMVVVFKAPSDAEFAAACHAKGGEVTRTIIIQKVNNVNVTNYVRDCSK